MENKPDQDRVEWLMRRFDAAMNSNERNNAESIWEDLQKYIIPNQSTHFQSRQTPGQKKTIGLYTSDAILANRDLAAAMHSTLTNPATKWSKLRYNSEALNNDEAAIEWLETCNNEIHRLLNESNFDTQVSKNYRYYCALGNMLLMHTAVMDGTKFEKFNFEAVNLADVAWTENHEGMVDSLFWQQCFTVKQAYDKFGKRALNEEMMEKLKQNPDAEYDFRFIIMPRPKEMVELNELGLAPPNKRPYMSVWIRVKDKAIVEESGYYELPFYAVRFDSIPGEEYGRGPGHDALPDIKSLNKMREDDFHAKAKMINPPMIVDQRGVVGDLNTMPGGLIMTRGGTDAVKPLQTMTNVEAVAFSLEQAIANIQKIFYIDKLLLPPRTETGEMTAFEIAQRVEQMQRVLGPTLSRLNNEFLSPLIVRCFKILLRSPGALPEPPAVVAEQGLDIDVSFVNQLARSQQIQEVNEINAWVAELGGLAQLKPEVLDNINADYIAQHVGRVRGVPEKAIANEKDIKKIREERAKMQQQQMQLEQANQMADVAAKVGGVGGSEE